MFKSIFCFLLLAMCLPVYGGMSFEIKEYGFFPEDERSAEINSIKQIDKDVYAVGAAGLVIKIVDDDWEYVLGDSGLPELFDIMRFDDRIVLLSENNKLLSYNSSWEQLESNNIDSEGNLIKAEQNGLYSFMLSNLGNVLRKENISEDWVEFKCELQINNIIIENSDVFLVADNGKYYFSDDFGKTFKLEDIQDSINIRSISKHKNHLVICGDANYIMYSSNNGHNWEQRIVSENLKKLGQIVFINDSTLISSHSRGSIITNNLGSNWETHIPYWDTDYSTGFCKSDMILYIYKNSFIKKINYHDQFNEVEIFSQENIGTKKIHPDESGQNIGLLSGSNFFYKRVADKPIFKKMTIPIISFNDACFKDSLIYIATDSVISGTTKLKNSNLIIYDLNSNYKSSITLDSNNFFSKVLCHRNTLYLFANSFYNYYFEYDLKSDQLEKIVLTDSLKISKIKFINNELYIAARSYDLSKKYIVSVDSDNEIKSIINLPIEQYPNDFTIDSNGDIISIHNPPKTGHQTDSFIHITKNDGSGYRTVFSQLESVHDLRGICDLGHNEYIMYGFGNLIYSNDNFDTYSQYTDDFLLHDFKQISNKFYTIIGLRLFSVSLTPTSVREKESAVYPLIYPNPIHRGAILNIILDNSIYKSSAKIYNTDGSLISEYVNQSSIPITNIFVPGAYFLVVESLGEKVFEEKFIVR